MAKKEFVHHYPRGFRPRRGLNWVALGLMYASYYMCRYNFRWATPGMVEEFGFTNSDIANILGFWSLAYGTGQLLNGLMADRIGGKKAMLIGACATIVINLIYGFSTFMSTATTFALVWLINGYFQAWGAPGMIKINAAWFRRQERGTFAGIFGFMIQLGQISINNLAPFLLAGFAIGTFFVADANDWRWLFRIPPLFTAAAAILLAFVVKESPEEAGYSKDLVVDEVDASDGVTIPIKECFKTIFTHPLIWFYAVAYACTGAARHSSDQLAILFFVEQLGLDLSKKPAAVFWTMNLMPLMAVFGSLASGFISDKFFVGHRAPVAMVLYFFSAVILAIGGVFMMSGSITVLLACVILVLISLPINATHSIVGAAAPMDIGGRKMAGFASGVIDSFQYYGAAIILPITGKLLDLYGWGVWFPIMSAVGVIGGLSMLALSIKKKKLAARGIHVHG